MTDAAHSKSDVECEACGARIPEADAHTDGDGFTGCRPCFLVSNNPADADRFMRGPCHCPKGLS